MQSNSTDKVVGSAQRPFVQRYFMLIFLAIVVFVLYILMYLATGLEVIPLAFLVLILTFYGICVGLIIRNGYKRRGYVFNKTTRYLVVALIAAALIICLTVSLGDSGTREAKNLITLLLNLPKYHYFADDIIEMSNVVYGISANALMLLMPVTGIMIAVDAKENRLNENTTVNSGESAQQ